MTEPHDPVHRDPWAHTDDVFADIRARFDALAAGQRQIIDMLTTLIDRRDGWRPARSGD